MNKVQTKRLLNVARALREAHAAKKKFDMGKWVFGDETALSHDFDLDKNCTITKNEEANFCGTPACALGHYAARTDLQRILKVSILKNHEGIPYATMDAFGGEPGCDWDDEVVCQHFGITDDEFYELFDAEGCGGARTALQAAKYIEKFVVKKQFPGRDTDKQPGDDYYNDY